MVWLFLIDFRLLLNFVNFVLCVCIQSVVHVNVFNLYNQRFPCNQTSLPAFFQCLRSSVCSCVVKPEADSMTLRTEETLLLYLF